jgi:hypothetical protein
LYEEIVAQGYTGSRRTLEMRLRAFRPHGAHPVSKQTITLEKPPSARSTALMIVRPVQNRTPEQTAYLAQFIQSDATVAKAFTLAQDFGRLLRKQEGLLRLEQWKTAVRASGIAELIAFADGLADDAEAVANGCSMTWNNGMVEGFVNKVKAIKRSSYGQAGFPLLQRRVLLHPAARVSVGKEQVQRSSRKSVPSVHQDASAPIHANCQRQSRRCLTNGCIIGHCECGCATRKTKRGLSQNVPKAMQARFDEITQLTDAFCQAFFE